MIKRFHRISSSLTSVIHRGRTFSVHQILLGAIFFLLNVSFVSAQEIDFEDFSDYSVTVAELAPAEDLDFGMVIQNEGIVSVDILNAKVMMIEGVKYLDVLVDITADDYLFLDNDVACNGTNSNCIPFTLEAAYANKGSNNTNQAILMQVASNIASAYFPILGRGNRPAGPPPTPVYEGYDPALHNETAYLYIYGFINVGNLDAGSYTGNVTITVSYD